MKGKIIGIAVDVLLIALVFFLTDTVVIKWLRTENIWIELGIYLGFYATVYGIKAGIVFLWRKMGR